MSYPQVFNMYIDYSSYQDSVKKVFDKKKEEVLDKKLLSLIKWGIKHNVPEHKLPRTINELKNIRKLSVFPSLDYIATEEIPCELSHMTWIKELSLRFKFNYIPEWLGGLNNLEVLTIGATYPDRSKIIDLPESLRNLKKLKKLEINELNFVKLPEWIGELTDLEELVVYDTNLKKLPESLRKLKKLKKLKLYENKVEQLPEWIGDLSNLEEFFYSFTMMSFMPNSLKELPDSFQKLKKLKKLSIKSHQLKFIPAWIGSLNNIEELTLTYSKLIELPESLKKLKKLKSLSLEGNNLKLIPDWIGGLSDLEILGISGNDLKVLPESMIKLTKLEQLSLNDNELNYIPEWVGSLNNLEYFSCDNNKLKELPISLLEIMKRY